jgi:hypothetical protein
MAFGLFRDLGTPTPAKHNANIICWDGDKAPWQVRAAELNEILTWPAP